MANVKNAPNASRVSLYVPAENRYEDLLLWYMYRARCRRGGTSVFRQLVQFIRSDLAQNPPTEEELNDMHEEARKHNVSATSAPVKGSMTKEPTPKGAPAPSVEDLNTMDFDGGA